jgi:transcriptional regulator with XRE-family HTH domain
MADEHEGAEIISFPTRSDREDHQPDGIKVRDAIGGVLREERTDQERTLSDVATSAAVSLQYLSEIERGRKEVSSDLLASVCHALEVEVADVLERAARHLRAGSQRSDPQAFALAA